MINRSIAIVLALVLVDLVLRFAVLRRTSLVGSPAGRYRWPRTVINLAGFSALAVATFTASLGGEVGLTGDRLIWHVTGGGAFACASVAVAICWAHRNRFTAADGGRIASAGGWATPLRKFFFWVAVVLAVPTLLAILGPMFPYFDTEGQENLLRIHRNYGPLLSAAGFLFGYFAFVTWAEGRGD